MSGPATHPPLHFRARHRLTHARQFQAVYGARVRKARGPLTIFALPNELGHPRLGLSVGRRVGSAVVRNAVKRRVREAFRHLQYLLPHGYDLVVNVQPHAVAEVGEYQSMMAWCLGALDKEWGKRRAAEPEGGGDAG